MILKKIFIISFLFLILLCCKFDPFKIDINNTKVEINFMNMDSLLFNTPESNLHNLKKTLSDSISEIFDYQIGYCMRIGKVHDTAFVNSILQYRADTTIQQLENEIANNFNNLNVYKSNLILAFRYLKTHLPNSHLPKYIVFQNSLFNSSAFCTEHEIGIGLEQYLGENSPIIQSLPTEAFYEWMKKGFDKKYLERDAILSWVLTHILPETDGNLAEKMIYYGKALFITEASLPNIPKNIIIRYNENSYQWAKDNEYSFWKYLVDEKLLFKTDERTTTNLLSEGPFTPGLPEKAPDRLGQYLGWQMVKNYVQKNKITIKELIEVPYNTILQSYEP